MAARRRAAAPVEAVEELEELEEVGDELEEVDDLEELEEEPVPAKPAKRTRAAAAKTAPAKSTKTAAAPKAAASEGSEYDSNWLAEHVSEETGIDHDGRAVRMLLRKLAKDGAFAREIGEDRSRYTFPKGANDPVVRKIVAMVKSGEAKAVRTEGLETAKAAGAAKKTAAKAAPAKAAAKAAPVKATSTRTSRTRRAAAATE